MNGVAVMLASIKNAADERADAQEGEPADEAALLPVICRPLIHSLR